MKYNNNNFCEMVKNHGKSLYIISKETGIPFTTLNQLKMEDQT